MTSSEPSIKCDLCRTEYPKTHMREMHRKKGSRDWVAAICDPGGGERILPALVACVDCALEKGLK